MFNSIRSIRPKAIFVIMISLVVVNAIWSMITNENKNTDGAGIVLTTTPQPLVNEGDTENTYKIKRSGKGAKPLALKLGKSISIGKVKYSTFHLGSTQWMAKNLNYPFPKGGSSFYKIEDRRGKLKDDPKMGMLYTQEAAQTACEAIGMQLPTRKHWIELLSFISPPSDNQEDGYMFNRTRAFGLLMNIGNDQSKFKFNGELGGVKIEWPSENYSEYDDRDSLGLYWTSDVNDNGFPTFLLFDAGSAKVTPTYYTSLDYIYYGSCRCILDSRPYSQQPQAYTKHDFKKLYAETGED